MNLFLNDATEGAASEQVIANIQKLLKDPKNKDYQGELYYSLAIISLNQNKKNKLLINLIYLYNLQMLPIHKSGLLFKISRFVF